MPFKSPCRTVLGDRVYIISPGAKGVPRGQEPIDRREIARIALHKRSGHDRPDRGCQTRGGALNRAGRKRIRIVVDQSLQVQPRGAGPSEDGCACRAIEVAGAIPILRIQGSVELIDRALECRGSGIGRIQCREKSIEVRPNLGEKTSRGVASEDLESPFSTMAVGSRNV